MSRDMAADGFPIIPYVTFKDWHDLGSGLVAWAATPRFSQGYAALQNRPGPAGRGPHAEGLRHAGGGGGRLLRHTLGWLNDEAAGLRAAVTAPTP